MRAGLLRNRITIEQNTPTRDSFGAEVEQWSTFATLWAMVETVSGLETINQQQAAALTTHRITLRFYDGVEPAMRVNWDGRLFDIHSIEADPAHGEMQLICSEVIRG